MGAFSLENAKIVRYLAVRRGIKLLKMRKYSLRDGQPKFFANAWLSWADRNAEQSAA